MSDQWENGGRSRERALPVADVPATSRRRDDTKEKAVTNPGLSDYASGSLPFGSREITEKANSILSFNNRIRESEGEFAMNPPQIEGKMRTMPLPDAWNVHRES